MSSSLDPIGKTVKNPSSGSVQKFYDSILSSAAAAVEATSGVLWDATEPSFRVLSIYPEKDADFNLLLDSSVESKMLKKVSQASGPIFCHPDQSNHAANAILFGKINLDEPIIVGLTLPTKQLHERDLHDLKSKFVNTLKILQSKFLVEKLPNIDLEGSKTSKTRAIGIRELDSYLRTIHSSIDTIEVAANIANETRRLLNCDRVSVLVRKRGKYYLQAVSGQYSINHRSQTTQLLQNVAAQALISQQAFWYPDETIIPTQIGKALDDYLSISAVRNLVVIPLLSDDGLTDSIDAPVKRWNQNAVIGGMVFEHYHERWDRSAVEPAVAMLTEHCGMALRNAMRHEQIFLFPIWKTLGRSKLLTAPRMLPKMGILATTLLMLVLVLFLWTVDFYVSASGTLVPENTRPVFASVEGKVQQILVEHGDYVASGQTVLKLTSLEHDLRIKEVESGLATARQRLTIVQDQRHKFRTDDPQKVEENLVSLYAQIESLEAQRTLLQKISNMMNVTSPLDGQVVTWDLNRKLENRVVNSGMQLLEVAEVDGRWLLEIELPIQRMGHIQRALENNQTENLRVSFLLASDTLRRYSGRVLKMENSVALNSNNQQVIRIWASIDDKDISLEQVRTGVTARIYCDKTSLGYFWFHGISEFFTRNIHFKYF